MLGAGVFVVWGPAASAAGHWLLAAVALAAVVAALNAASVARLAALHPAAGGAYTYGSRELRGPWGFVAGTGFILGKVASVAAMALAIGLYVAPQHASWVATAVVAASWALNARGVTRTAAATTVIAVIVVAALACVVAVSLASPAAPPTPASALEAVTPWSVAQGAALIFFAFAGYARLATLGEEVRRPRTTIPRAIAAAFAIVAVVYVAVAVVVLRRPGIGSLAASSSPLVDALPDSASWRWMVAGVAALAAGGAMVALTAGIGRTIMAMARQGDLPRVLARTGRRGVPQLAEAVASVASIGLVWWGDLAFALAMSSVSVLAYYAVAHAAAFAARTRSAAFPIPRPFAGAGLALCVVLAASLEALPTLVALGIGALAVAVRHWARRRRLPAAESQDAAPR